MLVYTAVLAIVLTIFFDLSRIASLGAMLYLVMDIMIHWGVLRHMRKDIKANPWIIITAIVLDLIVLGAFIWVKASQDVLVVIVAGVLIVLIFIGEKLFLKAGNQAEIENN